MKTNTSSITTIMAVLGPLGSLIFLTATSTLQAGHLDFEGPGYVVGQRPPPPWFCEGDLNGYSNTVFRVVGTPGAQYLAVQDSTDGHAESGYYPLPRALTVEGGAQRITMRVAPPNAAVPFFAGCGYVGIAFGINTLNVAVNRIGFGGNDTDTHSIQASRYSGAVGWIDGEYLGEFQPGEWHEVTFDINTDWTEVTISVKRPDGTVLSSVEHVSAGAFDAILCGGSWRAETAGPILLDDLGWPKYRASFDSIKSSAGGIELKMFGELGQVYDLEHTADLAGAWQTLTTLTNTAWTMTHTDTTATNHIRFYRLREK